MFDVNQDRKNEFLVTKDEIAKANSAFWDEICGSGAFRHLGLTEVNGDSLSRFDDWYFETYPYLLPWLANLLGKGSKVVEVGLGYGSVGQYLADNSLSYVGVDIAQGPVDLMTYRLSNSPPQHSAICANVLSLPIGDASQDLVIAIGSLHHVGDFESSLEEIARILGPNGRLGGMVYAAYSLRSIFRDPRRTLSALASSWRNPARFSDSERLRTAADVNSEGVPAPYTEFFSKAALRAALETNFGEVKITRRNANSIPLVGQRLRKATLAKPFQWLFSLDLYFSATVKK